VEKAQQLILAGNAETHPTASFWVGLVFIALVALGLVALFTRSGGK
jgi:tetrahydromethanopterin S-methyltransferase subunit B